MSKIIVFSRMLSSAEEGQNLVEYGLILSLVTVVGVAGLALLGNSVVGMWESVRTLADAVSATL